MASGRMFNMIMDEIYYSLRWASVCVLAYTDDLTLFARASLWMQRKFDVMKGALAATGMVLNPSKSLVLTIKAHRKDKCLLH